MFWDLFCSTLCLAMLLLCNECARDFSVIIIIISSINHNYNYYSSEHIQTYPHQKNRAPVKYVRFRHSQSQYCNTHVPDAMAVADLRPAASTMLPSVWTTIKVAFWELRPSPSWRVVLPLCDTHTINTLKEIVQHGRKLSWLCLPADGSVWGSNVPACVRVDFLMWQQ